LILKLNLLNKFLFSDIKNGPTMLFGPRQTSKRHL
jgi:hypothetical protein